MDAEDELHTGEEGERSIEEDGFAVDAGFPAAADHHGESDELPSPLRSTGHLLVLEGSPCSFI